MIDLSDTPCNQCHFKKDTVLWINAFFLLGLSIKVWSSLVGGQVWYGSGCEVSSCIRVEFILCYQTVHSKHVPCLPNDAASYLSTKELHGLVMQGSLQLTTK